MAKTWPIECDMKTLDTLMFCMEQMIPVLEDEIASGSKYLRSDLKVARALWAEAHKAQVNLAVSQQVAKQKARK